VKSWLHTAPSTGQIDGGDVLFVSTCGYGHVYRFALADVSGHGNTVSAFADNLRELMRANIEEVDQTEFARQLNDGWLRDDRGGHFATAIFLTFLLPERLLVVCNAGHPRPLWYKADERRWRFLDEIDSTNAAGNLPLGIIAQTPYRQFAVAAGERDLLVLYTDAYIEARSDGSILGEHGLMAIASSLNTDSPPALGQALREAVVARANLNEDDRTLVIVAPHGADPRL
jgi:serine phosphatase RsbU (regulator of sigma subunit)